MHVILMHSMREREQCRRVALGLEPPSLLIRGGRVFSPFTGEMFEADVAVCGALIAGVGRYPGDAAEVIDATGAFVIPGFIDAHVHPETSMLSPPRFAEALVVHGITTTLSEPHEITNVMGRAGVDFYLRARPGLPLDLRIMLPTTVPASPFERAAGSLSAAEVTDLLEQDGSSITYLQQKPSPKVLQEAFAEVKPTIVFAVPLIIEKIYRKKVLPRIQGKLLLRGMTKVPLLRRVVYRKAVGGLLQAFGGQVKFMGFGGAALPADVERFLRIGGFPYAIGYGMTECSPLIAGSRVVDTRQGSCGTPVLGIELRIADPEPSTGVGEVQVRGPMVTQGYYRNAEATAALFTPDGFLRTGDLGVQDKDGFVYLKGRSKNMILGPSGENIFPEEIEHLLARSPSVVECIVVKKENGLVALVYPDYDFLTRELHLHGLSDAQIQGRLGEHFKTLLAEVNAQLAAYSRLAGFRLQDKEFDKTPTEKIKRHLYE